MKLPEQIEEYLQANPRTGRESLAKTFDISVAQARLYCQMHKGLMIESGNYKKGIATFDKHIPEMDRGCEDILFEFIEDFKPDYYVEGGDFMDFGCISSHNDGKLKLLENKRISKDYAVGNAHLDRLNALLPDADKRFIIGNHEYRVDRLLEQQPNLTGMLEIENHLHLDDWEIIPFNGHTRIGDMYFIHGVYHNLHFAKKHLDVYKNQIFFGHLHKSQVFTASSPVNTMPRQGVGVGCMCNLNPGYMHDKPNAWMHQFMYFYVFPDGSFSYYTPVIINGRVVINDKIYGGD